MPQALESRSRRFRSGWLGGAATRTGDARTGSIPDTAGACMPTEIISGPVAIREGRILAGGRLESGLVGGSNPGRWEGRIRAGPPRSPDSSVSWKIGRCREIGLHRPRPRTTRPSGDPEATCTECGPPRHRRWVTRPFNKATTWPWLALRRGPTVHHRHPSVAGRTPSEGR